MSVLAAMFLCVAAAMSQTRTGTIAGTVHDSNAAPVAGAGVSLKNPVTGYTESSRTDTDGTFAFNNVPLGPYVLSVTAAGFAVITEQVVMRSNVPLQREFTLAVAGTRASVVVTADTANPLDPAASTTSTTLSQERIAEIPSASRNGAVQKVIATVPGITSENNGLLHIRGVDDGLLYVVGGVPTSDRVDTVSASSFDIGTVRSVQVITGNVPAEYGGRNGAVAVVQQRSGIDEKGMHGEFEASGGSFDTADAAGSFAWGWKQRFGIFAAAAGSRSDRYLDPVDERNFNNSGTRRNFSTRIDWLPRNKDLLVFTVGANGADFDVPNSEIQDEAGQHQRQQLSDDNESISWQHTWNSRSVTNFAWFRRRYSSELFPSPNDIPITASQNREQVRSGMTGSLSYFGHGHSVKAGFEATHLKLREQFSFAVTDADLAETLDVSDAVLTFTPDNPFVFRDRRSGWYAAGYLQDEFSPIRNLTLSSGLRYDRSELPIVEQQWSPRIGVSYFVPRTRTVLRASFNRLYQPPQLENLLLSDSEQARALSPFVEAGLAGGAHVRAERVSAYEVGVRQKLWSYAIADVAYWDRQFTNFDDPNAFFSTTIVFPNSVDHGFARGVDVRLDVPERHGFSGYGSYTNSRILQVGPINGGLFLTSDFLEIGPETRFIPDHDERNVMAFGATYNWHRMWSTTFGGRHESGVPLEVDPERLDELRALPGADLANFDRGRVRPWTVFDLEAGWNILRSERHHMRAEINAENLFDHRYAYNFGNPFEGTHFGPPRMISGRLVVNFSR